VPAIIDSIQLQLPGFNEQLREVQINMSLTSVFWVLYFAIYKAMKVPFPRLGMLLASAATVA
jgi:hypothetical protein